MPDETTITAPSPSVGGEGAGGGTSIADSPTTVEVEPLGTPSPGVEPAEPEAAPQPGTIEETAKPGEPEGDGRLLPKGIQALKETNPEAYKAAKDLFFGLRAFKTEFPGGIPEARRLKQTFDLVGGEAGLQKMQTDNADFSTVAKQFMDGDPAFVADLAAEDPVAFGTHVPAILSKYKEIDPEGYRREVAKQISGEHAAWGLFPQLRAVYDAINSGKTDEAKEILNAIANWHDKIENLSKQEDDPRYKRLQETLKKERGSRSEQETEVFNNAYRSESVQGIDKAAKAIVQSYIKGKNYDANDEQLLMRNVIQEANQAMLKDKDFIAKRDLLIQRRDKEASVRFAVSAWERALGEAAKRVMRTFSRGATPAPTVAPTNGKPAPAKLPPGLQKVAPEWMNTNMKLVDRSKTPTTMILNLRQAVLLDGRKVTWA